MSARRAGAWLDSKPPPAQRKVTLKRSAASKSQSGVDDRSSVIRIGDAGHSSVCRSGAADHSSADGDPDRGDGDLECCDAEAVVHCLDGDDGGGHHGFEHLSSPWRSQTHSCVFGDAVADLRGRCARCGSDFDSAESDFGGCDWRRCCHDFGFLPSESGVAL
eukprot:gb/GFBE01012336.1/.p2 GENE.gb/GFBE01012336.1/~~gb/GFBE01012336.1/.p2  ORF type:complete len:162 (-),score=14.72 gb/GFBE01012336.1/:470-955(-)